MENCKTTIKRLRLIAIITSCILGLACGGSAQEWSIETVDSAGEVGLFTSIALDSSNNPHISYLEGHNLKYAKWTGRTWDIRAVDLSETVGFETSIALDSSNNPHICYQDSTNGDLRYAKWTGHIWDIRTVDKAGDVGRYASIALDSSNNPHISYQDTTNSDLKYAKWTGSTWDIQTVDSIGKVGYDASIALDSSNNPHISYQDITNFNLKYAKWTGSTWDIQTVDSIGNAGYNPSIALDSSDNPHISYQDTTNFDLKYAKWTGSKWDIQTVDSIGNVGDASIALDSFDNPHISYLDATNFNLKYTKWTGNTWDIQTVDSAGIVGIYISIALDSFNNPHISYHDITNFDLKYALAVPKPLLSVSPDPPAFDLGTMNAGETASRTFSISNTGGGTLEWSVSDDQPWITLDPVSGTNAESVTVNINTAGLDPASYRGNITVTSNGGTRTGNVDFDLALAPILSVSPDPPTFDLGTMNAGEIVTRKLSISNTGGGTLEWSVNSDNPWITLDPKTGTNAGSVTVNINTAGLDPASYSGSITLTSNGGTRTGNVDFDLALAPILSVSPDPPTFDLGTMSVGENASRTFSISNTGGGTLEWSVNSDNPWITLDPVSGTNARSITVNINTAGLDPASYRGSITVTSNGGTRTGNVDFDLALAPILSVSPDPPTFDLGTMNAGEIVTRKLSISNTGGGMLEWSVNSDKPWIEINPMNGTNAGSVIICVNTTGMAPKSYRGSIIVIANGETRNGDIFLNIEGPEMEKPDWRVIAQFLLALAALITAVTGIFKLMKKKEKEEEE